MIESNSIGRVPDFESGGCWFEPSLSNFFASVTSKERYFSRKEDIAGSIPVTGFGSLVKRISQRTTNSLLQVRVLYEPCL